MITSIPEYSILTSKIPVSQVSEGQNCHEVTTTKEIGVMLGISTAKAFDIMSKLEKEELAYKYGYKTKGARGTIIWEEPSNSNLKSHSLGWSLYSKIN